MSRFFTGIFALFLSLAAAPAFADVKASGASSRGFYGGVMLRDAGVEGTGLNFGPATAVWSRYATPTTDETASRSLVFGGYRWDNDVAVEAAFNSADKYALRSPTLGANRGVGLTLGSRAAGLTDVQSRSWNMDVYTSWAFYKNLALYGRLGYAQADSAPLFSGSGLAPAIDQRRFRDGVNYGVGLRYDMSSSLGLRLEYARFGRFVGEPGSTLPESDQVTFGVQFRF